MEVLIEYQSLVGFLLGSTLTVWLTHHFSVKQIQKAHRLAVEERRYNRKFDVLLQIKRDVNALYSKEPNSLTNLCHSLDDATLIFSSDKIRLAIATFLSQKGDAYSFDEINNIMNLMCNDIDPELEWNTRTY